MGKAEIRNLIEGLAELRNPFKTPQMRPKIIFFLKRGVQKSNVQIIRTPEKKGKERQNKREKIFMKIIQENFPNKQNSPD